jgi:Lipocalin-like domain
MLDPMKRWTSGPSGWGMVIVGLMLLAGAFVTAFAADSPLVGAWQLSSEHSAQAALYLFTATRYSMVLAATDRPDIVDTSKATADELRATWGPLLANAGTYEISGELITIHPLVAKIPVVMKPGANEVYRFRIEGRTLTLRQVRNARGVAIASAPEFKFVRVE